MMTSPLEKDITVPGECHGQRVDVALAQLFPDYSRSQLSQWLKDGLITVNEKRLKPKEKLFGGEEIRMRVSFVAENARCLPENIPLPVVFEDDDVLIINKPAGLVVHPGAGNPEHTLVNALLHHDATLSHLPRAGIIHRLDKETTGLLIVGKTLTSYTHLVRQMQAREIQRHYITLVHGHVISGATIDTCYGRHPRSRLKMAVCEYGKQAITHYSVRTHYDGFTLLDVKLMTGRTHQIRVHMAHINHPVVGDPLYGGRGRVPGGLSDAARQSLNAFKRQALHAGFLSLAHPVTHEILTCTAPLPDDFQSLLACLNDEEHA